MFDVTPYNKGVELRSTTLMGFIAGIDKLYKEGYDIDYRTVQQKGILHILYANKANHKPDRIVNKQMVENQRIIELEERIQELEEELEELKPTKSPGRPRVKIYKE